MVGVGFRGGGRSICLMMSKGKNESRFSIGFRDKIEGIRRDSRRVWSGICFFFSEDVCFVLIIFGWRVRD